MIKVAVAGGFDPFHDGHLAHIKGACELGDFLYVFVSNDVDMIRKKGKCNIRLPYRMEIIDLILKGLNFPHKVIETLDKDGTQAITLTMIKPDIFAKGGDRTPDNMPKNELQVCERHGIKIKYEVGGEKINNSSQIGGTWATDK